MLNIQSLRKEYRLNSLDIDSVDKDPLLQFMAWFSEAEKASVIEPNAMALATATPEGRPSCRTVLLKQIDESGLIFFTNYESRKGQELAANPTTCAVFYWPELERQVIVEGSIGMLSQKQSEAYFSSRPRRSQIGAWASRQDQVLTSRKELEANYLLYEKLYAEKEIPKPSHWGGYRIIPQSFEFWQGREDRLHDRLKYRLNEGTWLLERLSP